MQKTVDSIGKFDTVKEYLEGVADNEGKADEFKQHLVDDSMVVKKSIEEIIIKVKN